jgi:crescentin
MSKLGNFFGSKPSVPVVEDKSVVDLDNELFLSIARQLGKENESIRNLLIDAEQKINELDAIKSAIGKQVEPASKTLRDLEETKNKLGTAENKVVMLESECARLRETLTVTQQKFSALESTHAGQTTELTTRRTQVAELQGRVQQQSGEIKVAHDENRRLSERVALADKKTVQLESEGEATRQKLEVTRQKLTVSEGDRTTVQKSLDKALAEMSQMSQRLLDADKAFDDAKQKYESEIDLHKMNYEALKTRATLTNKLLEDTRNSMIERAKEIQSSIAA